MSPKASLRLDYVDIGKALALWLVVFSLCEGRKFGGWYTIAYISIFFFLSGYTFTYHDKNIYGTIKRKFKRLLIPYFLFTIFLVVLYNAPSPIDTSIALVKSLYARYSLYPLESVQNNIYFLQSGNMVLWFLPSMFTAYLLFLLLYLKRNHALWLIPSYCVISFLCTKLPILLPWSIDTAPMFAIFIFLGTWWRRKEPRMNLFYIPLLLIYLVICIINGGANPSVRVYGKSVILFLVGGFIACLLCLWLSKLLEHSVLSKPYVNMGKSSMTIFSLQVPVLHFLDSVTSNYDIPNTALFVFISGCLKATITMIVLYPVARALHKKCPSYF